MRGRPRKQEAGTIPPLNSEDKEMEPKLPSAKDKVKVVNLTNRPVQFSYGVIPANGVGYASYSDVCTFIDHIKPA